MPGTRKLGRKTDHRMSMLKGLVTILLEKGKLETTITRAKEVRALADKMVTLGKANTLAAKRQAFAFITKPSVVTKLFDSIAPIYEEKNGGYTRVLKLGPRRGDGAEMALIEMVDAEALYAPATKKEQRERNKADIKAAKKAEAKKEKQAKASAETAPAEAAPVEKVSIEAATVEEAPAEEAPVEEAPVEEAPVEEAPAEDAKPE